MALYIYIIYIYVRVCVFLCISCISSFASLSPSLCLMPQPEPICFNDVEHSVQIPGELREFRWSIPNYRYPGKLLDDFAKLAKII